MLNGVKFGSNDVKLTVCHAYYPRSHWASNQSINQSIKFYFRQKTSI